eukprot:2031492-Pyramimonas_sp.AAC.3
MNIPHPPTNRSPSNICRRICSPGVGRSGPFEAPPIIKNPPHFPIQKVVVNSNINSRNSFIMNSILMPKEFKHDNFPTRIMGGGLDDRGGPPTVPTVLREWTNDAPTH